MDKKYFLASDTVRGLLLALLGSLLSRTGLPVASPDLEQIVTALMQLGGLAWAAWGRAKAAQPLTLNRPAAQLLLLALLLPSLAAVGCATPNSAPEQTVRASAGVLLQGYAAADAAYLQLQADGHLSSGILQDVAKGLDRAKPLVVAYARLAALQSRMDAYHQAKVTAESAGQQAPAFDIMVPPERVLLAWEAVAAALGKDVIKPESGEAAVLAFLSTHLGQLYDLASMAVDELGNNLNAAKTAKES